MKIVLSVVSFLNTRPLIYGIEQRLVPHRFEVRYDVPSRCAELVHSGEAAIGLIPSIEYARSQTPLCIVPGLSIASRGAVRSIFLFYSTPIDRIRTVAMDTNSRTSVALTRIVLNDRYGVVFESCAHPPDMDAMLGRADAALVIGDPALENADRTTPHLDLGAEWTALTGLPFVYAFWAGRPDAVAPADVAALRRSAEAGIPRIPEIAAEYARTRNHPTAFYTAYLSDHLSYALGPEEQAGLMEFYRRALRLGLIDHIPTISNFEE